MTKTPSRNKLPAEAPAAPSSQPALEPAVRSGLRYGFTALLVFGLGGLGLEFLHLIKAAWYLEDPLRRELWVLGHAHGAVLALLVLAHAAATARWAALASAGLWLRCGAALIPAGFLLGGVGNTEGDPSLLIALTPLGAASLLTGLALAARAVWRA